MFSIMSKTKTVTETISDDYGFFGKLKEKYVLLQQVNCSQAVKIAELAEELDIHKTSLMKYILDKEHRNLFLLNIPKNGTGLEISKIYNSFVENPITNEWLENKVKENEYNIWACPIREFNAIAGWTIIPTEENPELVGEQRGKHLWKNSKEKVEKVLKLGFLHKQQFYFGPFNERTPRVIDNVFLDSEKAEVIEKFKNAGWNLILDQ